MLTRHFLLCGLVCILGATGAAAGCSAGAVNRSRTNAPAQTTPPASHGSQAALHTVYSALPGLVADSTLIVDGTVTTRSRIEDIGSSHFEVQTVTVKHIEAGTGVGSAAPTTVDVRFPQNVGNGSLNLPVLKPGQQVLLFLVPFVFSATQPTDTGEYALVGGPQGVYYADSSHAWRSSWVSAPAALKYTDQTAIRAVASPPPGHKDAGTGIPSHSGLASNVPPAIRVLSGLPG